jgi:rifampicin phosphotransferase
MKSILFFDEISKGSDILSLVGGKAHSLSVLFNAGFPVPPGFCLTSAAFQDFSSKNNLYFQIEQLLVREDITLDEKAALIQAAYASAPFPPALSAEIIRAYSALAGDEAPTAVAVRSSARAEDGIDFSFAGQYDTLLNVMGSLELLDAVRSCWASLWSARALSYRSKHDFLHHEQFLPLIVQTEIPARHSGVIFTVDPTNAQDVIILEVVEGKGEGLVSGLINPIRYRLDKSSLNVLDFSQPDSRTISFSREKVRRAALLALEVERFTGSPVDIEWAECEGQIYLLQSRPITALPKPVILTTSTGQVNMEALQRYAEQRGSDIWTDDNVGEVFPDVVTPLTWSVLEPMGNLAFRAFLRRVGIGRYPKQGLFGRFYGRVYFNQSQFQRLVSRFYPSRLGSSKGQLANRLKSLALLALTGFCTAIHLPLALWIGSREVKKNTAAARRTVPSEILSKFELWEETEDWVQTGQKLMEKHLAVTIFAALLYGLLDKLVRTWSNGTVETTHLTAGLDGMLSAEIGHDLAALSRLAYTEPALIQALVRTEEFTVEAALLSMPSSSLFKQALDRFLEKHGHASLQEFELSFPRWHDDPVYVVNLLRSHLQENNRHQKDLHLVSPEHTRKLATAEMRRLLVY